MRATTGMYRQESVALNRGAKESEMANGVVRYIPNTSRSSGRFRGIMDFR